MPTTNPSKDPYQRPIGFVLEDGSEVYVNLYDIINASRKDQSGNYRQCLPSDPAVAHAVKKLLYAGSRPGGKGLLQDLTEALVSVQNAIDAVLNEERQ